MLSLERAVLPLPSKDFLRGFLNNTDEALPLPLTVDVGAEDLRESLRIRRCSECCGDLFGQLTVDAQADRPSPPVHGTK